VQCHIPDCGKTCSTIYNLRTHIKLHDRDCKEACQVPGCAAKFSTRWLLDNHMKEQHPTYNTYRSLSVPVVSVDCSTLSLSSAVQIIDFIL